jgi:hypothetical protein
MPGSSGSGGVGAEGGSSGETLGMEEAGSGARLGGSGAGSSGGSSICPDPGQVYGGKSCTVPDLICPSAQGCINAPPNVMTSVRCACLNRFWTCSADPSCSGVMCPPSETILPGDVCNFSGARCHAVKYIASDCAGNPRTLDLTCICQLGTWTCTLPVVASCFPDGAPPCPDPSTVLQNKACVGLTGPCSGNPHLCDGTTFYDVLECSNSSGVWVTLASTVCGSDSGPPPPPP